MSAWMSTLLRRKKQPVEDYLTWQAALGQWFYYLIKQYTGTKYC